MPRPLISINTCAFNAARFIDETLDSVLRQTLSDFEIVIVDDGSTDGTPERIERRGDPRIKLIRQNHITLRLARSIALAHSEGEYLAFLDSDDLWHAHKLERQLEVARQIGEPALIVSDADLIDERTQVIGKFSDGFPFATMDLSGTNGYFELLRHGNFVASPTPLIATDAIRRAGGFNHDYRHVNDFELWLRLCRSHRLVYLDERLAQYRVHADQFTRKRMDITLPEQCALLNPIINSSLYPIGIRTSLGDNMLGQHRLAARTLFQQGRWLLAARAALGMLRYPDRLRDSVRHQLKGSVSGTIVESGIAVWQRGRNAFAHAGAFARNELHRARLIATNQLRKVRLVRSPALHMRGPHHIWIDGTCLHREQTGYFNLLAELIRRFSSRHDCQLHVIATRRGREALRARLGNVESIDFHAPGWRSTHWSEIHHAIAPFDSRVLAKLIRVAWRWWPRPTARKLTTNTTEVLFWRGRFRFRDSHRVAIVQDMTTRLHPEWHTPGNVREFDEFLRYVQQHAQEIITVSHSSRRDIIERIAVPANRVSVLPMPINPAFHSPSFMRGWLTLHRISQPYVLCVGTIEPRKNLRRLVKAFELLRESDAFRDHVLVLVGGQGWDASFEDFLAASDVATRVIRLGFVPTDQLPSLYHFASAVVQPSLYEGFGIPVMEAMCSSSIVIASNRGSLPEVLGPGGVTFDPADSHAIARALLWAISLSPEEADAYRRQCRINAEHHLNRMATEPLIPGVPPESVVLA